MPIPVTTWEQRLRYEDLVKRIAAEKENAQRAILAVSEAEVFMEAARAKSMEAQKQYEDANFKMGELRREFDELCSPSDGEVEK